MTLRLKTILAILVFVTPKIVCSQTLKVELNKRDLIIDIAKRVSTHAGNLYSVSNFFFFVNTRAQTLEFQEGPSFSGIIFRESSTDKKLLVELDSTFSESSLFLEKDSVRISADHYLPSPFSGIKADSSKKEGYFSVEIERPIEGWENIELFRRLRRGDSIDTSYYLSFLRIYISIPISIYSRKNNTITCERFMYVYKILYKESKLQFNKIVIL